jgi:hypothetical protein
LRRSLLSARDARGARTRSTSSASADFRRARRHTEASSPIYFADQYPRCES